MTETVILNHKQIEQKINRLAYQIYENNYEETEIIMAGIVGNGFSFAEKIAKKLSEISPIKIKLCTISLNKSNPLSQTICCNIQTDEINNKAIIVVDDVLDSGKTLIYGVRYFLDFPVKRLRTLILVDRSHMVYPIKADYVGLSLATTIQEHIRVYFENDNDKVVLM
jgi:pyrimidine operon attenuation protein/uracil phosphoribosyltransferase